MNINEILKPFDLEFGIVLDKEIYRGEETVKGTINIISKKGAKVRGLRLIVEGDRENRNNCYKDLLLPITPPPPLIIHIVLQIHFLSKTSRMLSNKLT